MMANLESFRTMIRQYYRKTYNEDGKKHTQQDLADMLGSMNEDELGKRLHGYHDKKTGRIWRLTPKNVLDIVLVLAEWQAIQGKQAVELLALMDYPLDTPEWKVRLQKHFSLSSLAELETPQGVTSAIAQAAPQGECLLQPRRRLFQARDLPKGHVLRPKVFNAIKRLLLTHENNQTTAITTALRGAGGFGKTTLASALCHDPEIQAAFPDGVLWVELGEHPFPPLAVLNQLLHALESSEREALTLKEARDRWRDVLEGRTYLLVIDDVWQREALEELLKEGPRCGRLITTRNDRMLPDSAKRVWVDTMEPEEAMELLCQGWVSDWYQTLERSLLEEVILQQLGCWPLLVTLARGMLTLQVNRLGKTPEQALALASQAYQERGMAAFHLGDQIERQRNADACVEVNLRQLEEWVPTHFQARQRCLELAVFPEDTEIPLSTLQTYWQGTGGLRAREVEELCLCLSDLSLVLPWKPKQGTVRLHDVLRRHLIQKAEEQVTTFHELLLQAFQQYYHLTCWSDLPQGEAYLWHRLIFHLCQAGSLKVFQTTLTDLRWLMRKALYVGVSALEADLVLASMLPPPEPTETSFFAVLHRSVVRISHLLRQAQTEAEMGGLLLSYLGWDAVFTAQRPFLERDLPRPFLTAWHPLPEGSSAALLRTLHSHTEAVQGCAFSPNGRFIVSASFDDTLKIWDAATGVEQRTLKGHTEAVEGCAFSPDGRFIVSASIDKTLKVWDAATGAERLTLKGHTSSVLCCAFSPDGHFIVSASTDGTLKVWNGGTGRCMLTFPIDRKLFSCAFHPDGEHLGACGELGMYFLRFVV